MAQSSAAPSLAARPSLTLTRRLHARPEKVYAAWADPLNLVQWFALSQAKPGSLKAELDVRVGGATASAGPTRRASISRSAASIARSCRTNGSNSPGRGIRRRNGNRW